MPFCSVILVCFILLSKVSHLIYLLSHLIFNLLSFRTSFFHWFFIFSLPCYLTLHTFELVLIFILAFQLWVFFNCLNFYL